jgi:hypothetical protein
MTIPAEVQSRLGEAPNIEALDADALVDALKQLHSKWVEKESEKFDIEYLVKVKDMQIHDLEMEVSDMRGKFILPKLKKVHNFKLMGGEE